MEIVSGVEEQIMVTRYINMLMEKNFSHSEIVLFTYIRIYSDPKVTFSELIKSIINNKIDEIVNNAKKVNTATSQFSKEGLNAK